MKPWRLPAPFLLLVPAATVLAAVVIVPLVLSLWSSFTPFRLIRPETFWIFVGLRNYANILMKAGKPEEALRHFDHAIEIDPSNSSFYLNAKAAALNQIGLTDKARAIYAQILERKDVSKETQRIVIKKIGDMKITRK